MLFTVRIVEFEYDSNGRDQSCTLFIVSRRIQAPYPVSGLASPRVYRPLTASCREWGSRGKTCEYTARRTRRSEKERLASFSPRHSAESRCRGGRAHAWGGEDRRRHRRHEQRRRAAAIAEVAVDAVGEEQRRRRQLAARRRRRRPAQGQSVSTLHYGYGFVILKHGTCSRPVVTLVCWC